MQDIGDQAELEAQPFYFIGEIKYMDLKQPLSFEEQLNRLKTQGIVVNDDEKAIEILKHINYYRFTGYALQFRVDPDESTYIDGTIFESIYNLYIVDERLRDLFRMYIEKVEVYYRTQISYGFSIVKCTKPPYDQHYDRKNFHNKKGYDEVIKSFNRAKDYYKDSLIVKHHKTKYNSKMPLWVMVELMSFSNLSKLYSSMYISEQNKIAQAVGIGRETLENHLHCISVLRNKCAHAARLYNTEFYPPVRFTSEFLRKNPEVRNNSLFAYTLVLLKRLPEQKSKRNFVDAVQTVIEQYKDDIDMSLIGFPKNYLEILNNNV